MASKRRATSQLRKDYNMLPTPARPSVNLLDLVDRNRYFPIHEHLWSVLPLRDALALSGTCHQLRTDFLRAFNVNKRLSRFVHDPAGLRSQLGKHGSLISGSFALQLLAHTNWPDSDLDIFVEDGVAATEFDVYLCKQEHYVLKSTKDADTYAMWDLVEIRTYRRPSTMDSHKAKIQLIITKSLPIIGILTGFYMTAVVNIISWNKAYAVFAKDTFIDRKTYMLQPLDTYFEGLLHKYNRRGWELNETIHRHDYEESTSIKGLRRLGDSRTWTIPLSIENVQKPTFPDFVLEHTTFTMRRVADQDWAEPGYPPCASYQISTKLFQHVALRHQFSVAQHTAEGMHGWIWYLAHRLDQHAMLQLMAMPPQERPEWFRRGQDNIGLMFTRLLSEQDGNAIRDFKHPDYWKYVDDKLPVWYKPWRAAYIAKIPDAVENLFP